MGFDDKRDDCPDFWNILLMWNPNVTQLAVFARKVYDCLLIGVNGEDEASYIGFEPSFVEVGAG